MKRNEMMRGFALIMAFLFAGCATYTPTLSRLNSSGPNVNKAVNGDLTLYVEEYATKEKSEKAFDSNLAREGVLPLLISLENAGKQSYEVQISNIAVKGRSSLKALSPEEAASKAKRDAILKALGWSLVVPIISIPVAVAASAIHTNSVNKKIVQDFATKTFPEGVIPPNNERSGFLFFELEEGQKDLAGLSLEVTARDVASGETVTITAPLPAATFKEIAKDSPLDENGEFED